MKTKSLTLYLFLFFPFWFYAQKIDNMASYRNMCSDGYLRFNYENDVFKGRDQDYTQGYNIELALPGLRKNPVNKLFLKPQSHRNQYGVSVEHSSFTPKDIENKKIQYGDRPFAAVFILKSFAAAADTIKHERFTSSLSIGLIGQGAFGREMQIWFHEMIGNVIPHGWKYQIRNDVILNYETGYEKQLFRFGKLFSLHAKANLQTGTLFTNASVSTNAALGLINNPYARPMKGRRVNAYVFAEPLLRIVGYDATMQGGLFNKTNPYTIDSNGIERFVTQFNCGLVLQIDDAYIEYSNTSISREFKSGTDSAWGGFRVGFVF